MKGALVLVAVLGLAAGCGGSTAASVQQVERVFAQHGEPFQRVVVPDPYLRPRPLLWPTAKGRAAIAPHIRGLLETVNRTTFSTLEVWVFDSAANARQAQELVPAFQDRKPTADAGSSSGFTMRAGNVIAEGSADRWRTTRAILTDLR